MGGGKTKPFRVEVPDAVLADLRARLKNTRFSRRGSRHRRGSMEPISPTSKELVEYWRTKYDWRAQERAINRFAHFKARR